ncbi:hypothetical protein ACHHYP_01753 [Achlya hypogyna]|uniref:[phosphatase 2A protein]-leucine-carboxy methyltransferase n=1 Tax=Achlya hypogyna TaxID=1202772 RepID=A0A1V9ZT15_ACHHY|nr:hypothetical protein ACHHYP_01753 [Achlya hypogyna]
MAEFAQTSDHGVAETAFDAIHCKISAVKQGYFHDDFVALFGRKPTRRIPLIHRGYYLRHKAVEAAVSSFLAERATPTTPVQILSFGAGFDTLFFRLRQQHAAHVSMYEIDCDAIVDQKITVLTQHFDQLFGGSFEQSTPWPHAYKAASATATYAVTGCDLGDTAALAKQLAQLGLDPTRPTLVLAECVLAYLAPSARSSLLQWTASHLSDALFVGYDPIGLATSFGEQMQSYFAAKGCDLRSAKALPSVHDQDAHFRAHGWGSVRLWNMNATLRLLVADNERRRMEGLEPFDEYDDWITCNHHYGFTMASNNAVDGASVGAAVLREWRLPTLALDEAVITDTYADGVTVRLFQPTDAPAVRHIFESTLDEYNHKSVRKLVAHQLATELSDLVASYMSQPSACFWVAERGSDFLGCVGVKPFKGAATAELLRLRVAGSGRRLGVATRLVDALEGYCRRVGYETVYLETLSVMEAAQAFYAKRGYTHVGSTRVGKPPADFGLEQFQLRL